ncbi:MAG: hypothetical protein IPJ07_20520 [Acidobacteria bacterium]|nr:hypothetical protein [Acidobacteriota bacterium]
MTATSRVSRDGSKTWKNVIDRIKKGVPANTYVTRVIASYASAAARLCNLSTAIAATTSNPYVYVTEDSGENWTSITSNMPSPANVIRAHPKKSESAAGGHRNSASSSASIAVHRG